MRSTILSAVAMAGCVSAHAQVFSVWVNGEDAGDGQNVYIRSPPNNNPVKDLSSPDIVCNVNGGTPAPEFVSVAAGDELAFEWYHDSRADDIIDGSHQGPIITWIAEYTEDDGTGAIWSKIDEDGYDGSEWAVDRLIANGGKHELTVPEGLAAGKYLIRQEIIALHESDTAFSENEARGAQFYPSCVQVEVTGSGSAVPDQGFDFNADYSYEDPGIVFDLYGDVTDYEIPGPEVWSGASGGDSPAETSSPAETGASTTDAASPSSPADDSGSGSDSPSASATDAPSSTETADGVASSLPVESGSDAPSSTETADGVASSLPVESGSGAASTASSPATDAPSASATEAPGTTLATATKSATTAEDEPSTTADDESAAPSATEGPSGCKVKRRSMKKRISAKY